ncbi:WecA-like glycosyltransferase [Polystyrenella longa]|uniref:WecA-like glycosyltransferase n=1 Tax=Polystyrenella longa TaxID=2528007 RepID=A0A518CH68_9PLAN|nr:WecA-like glycosyltransferase [Polystyrenella longa]
MQFLPMSLGLNHEGTKSQRIKDPVMFGFIFASGPGSGSALENLFKLVFYFSPSSVEAICNNQASFLWEGFSMSNTVLHCTLPTMGGILYGLWN